MCVRCHTPFVVMVTTPKPSLTLGDGMFVKFARPWIQQKVRPVNTRCLQIMSPKATRFWKKGDTFSLSSVQTLNSVRLVNVDR